MHLVVNLGDRVVLWCTDQDLSELQGSVILTWEKSHKTIPADDPRLNTIANGTLELNDVQREDGGIYRCTVKAGEFQSINTTYLFVRGRLSWCFIVQWSLNLVEHFFPSPPLPLPFPPIPFPFPPLISIRPDLFFNVLTYSINTTMAYSIWMTWNCFLSRQTLTNIPTPLPIRCLLYKHRYEFLWRYEVFSVMPKNTVEMKERLCGLKKKRNNDYILGFEHLRISHNISKVDGVAWNSRTNIFWGRGSESDRKLNQLGGENSLLMVRSNT